MWCHAVDALDAVERLADLLRLAFVGELSDVEANAAADHLVRIVGREAVAGVDETTLERVEASLTLVVGDRGRAPFEVEVDVADTGILCDGDHHLMCTVLASHLFDAVSLCHGL